MSNLTLGITILSTISSLSFVQTQNVVGNAYTLYSNNVGNFNVVKNGDKTPKGYVKGAVNITKFDLDDQNASDVVVVGASMSFVPGSATSTFEEKYDRSRKTEACEILISIKNAGGNPVYLTACPYESGISSMQITTTSGYNFGLLNANNSSISLKDGFRVEGGNSITNSFSYSNSVTTIVNDPDLISSQYASSYPAYYWKYKYDTSKTQCNKPLNQNFLFIVQTNNNYTGKKCGLNISIDIYMKCIKDWFSGDAIIKSNIINLNV